MEIFKRSKKKSAAKKDTPQEVAVAPATANGNDLSSVILRPRITEKASERANANVYVFDIHPNATKRDVAAAVRHSFKVTPVRVNVVPVPAKNIMTRRGTKGVKQGGKKAYVYLKKDETITVM